MQRTPEQVGPEIVLFNSDCDEIATSNLSGREKSCTSSDDVALRRSDSSASSFTRASALSEDDLLEPRCGDHPVPPFHGNERRTFLLSVLVT